MNLKPFLSLVAAVCALSAVPASAGVIYDNGPDAGNNTYHTIDGPYQVSDSFTLSSDSTVVEAILQVDVFVGDTPTSLDWLITTASFGGTTLASGTGVSLAATFDHPWIPNSHIGDVYQVSFGVPNLFLAAGTYWLQIQNATSAQGFGVSWAEGANNLGSASQTIQGTIPSESFELLSPEPASFVLFGSGILALAFARKFLRQA